MELDQDPSSSTAKPRTNIAYLPDATLNASPQVPRQYDPASLGEASICIDNGSHSWRAGFSTMAEPYIDRLNVVARFRERKQGRNILLFGRDTDADANARSNARSPFDGDLLIHGDVMEGALDYTFSILGINTSRIEHPITMTERLANPLFTRAMTSELLFELYGAPSVTFGIDSLFAFSRQRHQDGLAINLGYNATTVIPVVAGRGVLSRAKRIPWGGSNASELMLKLAQLKYPGFPVKVTPTQATFMYRETCYFSSDYEDEIRSLADPAKMSEMTKVIQFPFTQAEIAEKSEAELAAATERRREQGKRLQEMQARQRAEKLAAKQAELDEYKAVLALKETSSRSEFLAQIAETTPFESEGELENWVKRTEQEIRRKQRKDAGEEPEPEEEPTFPLVDRPDSELNDEEIKEKRRQRLMKAGWEARIKAREEKRKESERQEEIRRKEEEFRETDLTGWSAQLREEQDVSRQTSVDVMLTITVCHCTNARTQAKASAAGEPEIGGSAEPDEVDRHTSGRRQKDDGFGRDDSDWAVYREIGGDDESDAEEDDLNLLQSLEARLLQYDPFFTEDDTMEGRAHAKNALVNAFVRGGNEERFNPDSMEQNYQLHLNVERIRVPEALFQPSMFGQDCAGLGEVAGWVLNGFDEDVRRRIMQCIFVTGGGANVPNLIPRLRNTLTPVLPFRAPLKIVSSLDGGDPRLEAWRGMAEWSGTEEGKASRVTKAEYDEHGGEWLKEHAWGNVPP